MKEKWFKIFDRGCEYSLYGLILFIPVSNAGIEICFGLAFLCFLGKKIIKPDFRFLKAPEHIPLLCFMIFSALSLVNSAPYFEKSFRALLCKWSEYICIFLMIQDTLFNRRRLNIAASIFLIVAGIVGLDGLCQYFGGIEFLRKRPTAWLMGELYGVTGPFKHYNDFGAYLICVLSLSVALLVCSINIKKWHRLVLSFTAVLLGVNLLLTFSRGTWLGFGISLIALLCLSRRIKVLLPLIGVFVLALILTMMAEPVIKQKVLAFFLTGSSSGRLGIWQTAWVMVKENPFLGKGVGTFMARFSEYAPNIGIQYTHNCFLQIWAETGIFALLSFLSFLSILLVRSMKVCWNSSEPVLLGLICGILGFLAHSFFDTQFYSLQLAVLMWTMLGIIAAFLDVSGRESKED